MKLSLFQKELLRSALPGIVFVIIFFSVYAFIPYKGYASLLSLMLSFSLGAQLYSDLRHKARPNPKKYLKTGFQVTVLLSVFTLLGSVLGPYGWLGAAALILAFIIYKLYRRWDMFMKGTREIEQMIFGMSLDKKNWQEKKPRLPKIKL